MTLAPLTTGPHLVPANRLAFTTPVREAGGAGHWVTIGGGDDDEGDRVVSLAQHALDKGHARTLDEKLALHHLQGFVPQMKKWGAGMDAARASLHANMDRARPALEKAQGELAEREGKERVAQQQAAGAQREKEFAAHAHQQRLSNPEPRRRARATS